MHYNDLLSKCTWLDYGLHHWATVVRKYGKPRPCKLRKAIVVESELERRAFMRAVLGLKTSADERLMHDPWGNKLFVNERVITKIARNPTRTPYVSWLAFGIRNALELWQKEVIASSAVEKRRYYLAAIKRPSKYGIAIVAGQDNVVFNVIVFGTSYANVVRSGKLLETSYDRNSTPCNGYGCCDDVVQMEHDLGVALAERNEAIKLWRKLKQLLIVKRA